MIGVTMAAALWVAAGAGTPASRLPATVARQMADAIIAVNKSLGLESWPMHGAKPCIDRGGQGITAKDVGPDETRRCGAAAIASGFPELGQSFVLAVLMAPIGPVTVLALGTGETAGWGAYSCDPGRSCPPMKINPANKWGKRLAERAQRACDDPATVWFPVTQRACSTAATPTPTTKPPTTPPATK